MLSFNDTRDFLLLSCDQLMRRLPLIAVSLGLKELPTLNKSDLYLYLYMKLIKGDEFDLLFDTYS